MSWVHMNGRPTNGRRPKIVVTEGEHDFSRNRPTELALDHQGPRSVTWWGVAIAGFLGAFFINVFLTSGLGWEVKVDRPCTPVCTAFDDALCNGFGCVNATNGSCIEYGCTSYAAPVCNTWSADGFDVPYPDYHASAGRMGMMIFISIAIVHSTVLFFGLPDLDPVESLVSSLRAIYIHDESFALWARVSQFVALAAGTFLGVWFSGAVILNKTSPLAIFGGEEVDYRGSYAVCGHQFGGAALSRHAHANMVGTVFIVLTAATMRFFAGQVINTMVHWASGKKYNYFLVTVVGGIAQGAIYGGIAFVLAPWVGTTGLWSRDLTTLLLAEFKTGSNMELYGTFAGMVALGLIIATGLSTAVVAIIKASNEAGSNSYKYH